MTPDQHHLCGAYAVDALDDTERAAFEAHLVTCPDCQVEVAGLRSAAQALAVLSETSPSPRLRASVLDSITRVRPLAPSTGPDAGAVSQGQLAPAGSEPAHSEPTGGSRPKDGSGPTGASEPPASPEGKPALARVLPLRRTRATWLVAAAASAALVFGGLAWSPWDDGRPSQVGVSQIQAAGDATSITETHGRTRATVVRSRDLDRAAIIVSGLEPAPAGRTYQLWLADGSGSMHPAGMLVPAADGSAAVVLTGAAATASAVGVTVEPSGGSPAPTTDPLMIMELT